MSTPSNSSQRATDLPLSLAVPMPLIQFQLNQMLALTKWTAAMWGLSQNQLSRYSTFLSGGAPLGA